MFAVNDKMSQQCLSQLLYIAEVHLQLQSDIRTLLQAIFTPRISGTGWQIVKIFHMLY